MKNFRLLNTIFGWIAFLIAATTYLLTIEPTASFWDCGEFISAAYKLDVGHPPGAPFFMMTAKFFTLFTSNVQHVAMMVNVMSALCSAFTILFLFWTITYIGKKIIGKKNEELTISNAISLLAAGMIGALAYTFSDTFWYSAVEAEVYAYSSFFTAIVFWLILKWEENADREGSDRWLILIAYLMGLSIGVHLLNLLVIPAIVLVYYFKKYTPTIKGVIVVAVTSILLLAFVNFGLIPGFIFLATQFELLFVNTLGLQYNTGLFFHIIATICAMVWAIYETNADKSKPRMYIAYVLSIALSGIPFLGESFVIAIIVLLALTLYLFFSKKKIPARWLNTSVLMVMVLLMGYSSYALIMIRSTAQPTMDQNSPENVFSLKYYLNREQYGDRPLLYGATYNAPMKLIRDGSNNCTYDVEKSPLYAPKPKIKSTEKDEYVVAGQKYNYKKNDKFMMLFPRMYSSDANHVSAYQSWGDVKGRNVKYDFCGESRMQVKPTMLENLRFFFNYQINFMYWRYFMWNFSGRQNDIQGYGEIEHGNWITGISFIDNMLVGNQQELPTELKENKGRNTYYMLPLILGILGIFYMLNKGKTGKSQFWIVLILFFMTGLAIVVYLNQTPYQPRERDYAYAGSFYAFTIWIGIGVMAVNELISKFLPKKVAAGIASVLCLLIPIQMAGQNWDDHDRSGRTTTRDFGQNYLQSCEPNAILFSNGDNDTFPLWYNQEVEGVRTDMRVCNLSYLPTDWYIDQMKRQAYESAPLPISWHKKDYISGTNDVVFVQDMYDGKPIDMHTAFEMIKSNDPALKYEGEAFFPAKKLVLPIDTNQVISSGTVAPQRKNEIVKNMYFELPNTLYKGETMVMEMIKENNWKRPMYVCSTVSSAYYPSSLEHYFERTGLAMQILPINQRDSLTMNVNTDKMYENMMTKFRFGGIENPKVYLDDNIMRMCRTHRITFSYLAEALFFENDTKRAKEVLQYCDKVIPSTTVPYDHSATIMAHYYYQLGMNADGDRILDAIANNSIEYLKWYTSLTIQQQRSASNSIGQNLAILSQTLKMAQEESATAILEKYGSKFQSYMSVYAPK